MNCLGLAQQNAEHVGVFSFSISSDASRIQGVLTEPRPSPTHVYFIQQPFRECRYSRNNYLKQALLLGPLAHTNLPLDHTLSNLTLP